MPGTCGHLVTFSLVETDAGALSSFFRNCGALDVLSRFAAPGAQPASALMVRSGWVSTSTFPSASPAIKSRGASPIPNPTEPPPLCWASLGLAKRLRCGGLCAGVVGDEVFHSEVECADVCFVEDADIFSRDRRCPPLDQRLELCFGARGFDGEACPPAIARVTRDADGGPTRHGFRHVAAASAHGERSNPREVQRVVGYVVLGRSCARRTACTRCRGCGVSTLVRGDVCNVRRRRFSVR